MKRKIIKIDGEKCNGCALCVNACHEGAIQMVNGRAQLISDQYCDGFGDCLPACPTGAIEIIEREADAYNDEAVQLLKMKKNRKQHFSGGCPGTMGQKLRSNTEEQESKTQESQEKGNIPSELMQWPVQLKLVNPRAEYFEGAHLLVAADCTAFAYGDFHQEFIKGRITVIGCPKLDDNEYYVEKLTEILAQNNIRSITVVRMEVPCCTGIVKAVKQAIAETSTTADYKETIIGINGKKL